MFKVSKVISRQARNSITLGSRFVSRNVKFWKLNLSCFRKFTSRWSILEKIIFRRCASCIIIEKKKRIQQGHGYHMQTRFQIIENVVYGHRYGHTYCLWLNFELCTSIDMIRLFEIQCHSFNTIFLSLTKEKNKYQKNQAIFSLKITYV